MKEFHRDFANRTGLAQAWTVKSADRLFTCWVSVDKLKYSVAMASARYTGFSFLLQRQAGVILGCPKNKCIH